MHAIGITVCTVPLPLPVNAAIPTLVPAGITCSGYRFLTSTGVGMACDTRALPYPCTYPRVQLRVSNGIPVRKSVPKWQVLVFGRYGCRYGSRHPWLVLGNRTGAGNTGVIGKWVQRYGYGVEKLYPSVHRTRSLRVDGVLRVFCAVELAHTLA